MLNSKINLVVGQWYKCRLWANNQVVNLYYAYHNKFLANSSVTNLLGKSSLSLNEVEVLEHINDISKDTKSNVSDGSTASYYELPVPASELQDLISHRNMNAQMGEIFRACYRYGIASHSDKLRDAKKIQFYINAEIARLEKYESEN